MELCRWKLFFVCGSIQRDVVFRYTNFVQDSESATYNAVCALIDAAWPYLVVRVVNVECVNHVVRIMGFTCGTKEGRSGGTADNEQRTGKVLRDADFLEEIYWRTRTSTTSPGTMDRRSEASIRLALWRIFAVISLRFLTVRRAPTQSLTKCSSRSLNPFG